MSRRKTVMLDKVTLHVPPGADPQAVLRAVTKAMGQGASSSTATVRVTVPGIPGEGPQALAQRIGRATAAKLKSGGGA
ncbi:MULTISPECIES: hypothetical protein [Dinoroseobacter]|jgi:hypothetical protein|uniref:hypothetical protein n=1 Tax=Dinoroseobacter TaxID=309512 RepID=UPI0002E31AAA|nr:MULTISPECIES: hypothetical protein [Dinoroseobacter]MDD9717744.1 hypothetical protein [Dinoroseobacter sp. PD6]URF45728.1 hypothetical protein M8008_13195 [Dinoroseobacter shibae]URF50033.1 hypothetical protein M8007_13195 [Dinoroseobacter shibae]